jgi:hypothetical protein
VLVSRTMRELAVPTAVAAVMIRVFGYFSWTLANRHVHPRCDPRLRSERPHAALAGEPSVDATAVVVEDLSELIARVGQDTSCSDLVGLAGEEVAFDRDVMGAEGIASDRRGELEQEERTERRLGMQVGDRASDDEVAAPIGT